MNQMTNHASGGALANTENNAFAAYGAATTQRSIVGELLKFSKGEFLAGQNGQEVPEGTRLVANMDELLVGWIKWDNGAPADQVMGKIAEGYQPPRRNELGDTDKDLWELDDQGQQRDPWQFSNYLLLKDAEDDQLYTFTTSSRGGLNAIGELCKVFGKEMRQRPGDYPVIELQVDSYKHSNKQYGKIFVPVLKVVGWSPKAEFGEAEAGDAAAVDETPPAGRGKAQKEPASADAARF